MGAGAHTGGLLNGGCFFPFSIYIKPLQEVMA